MRFSSSRLNVSAVQRKTFADTTYLLAVNGAAAVGVKEVKDLLKLCLLLTGASFIRVAVAIECPREEP